MPRSHSLHTGPPANPGILLDDSGANVALDQVTTDDDGIHYQRIQQPTILHEISRKSMEIYSSTSALAASNLLLSQSLHESERSQSSSTNTRHPDLNSKNQHEQQQQYDPHASVIDNAELVVTGSRVVAIAAYTPMQPDELAMQSDDLIVILQAPAGGWWRGTLGIASDCPKTGWFPSHLVKHAISTVDLDPDILDDQEYSELSSGPKPLSMKFSKSIDSLNEPLTPNSRQSWLKIGLSSAGIKENGSASKADIATKRLSGIGATLDPNFPNHNRRTRSSSAPGGSLDALNTIEDGSDSESETQPLSKNDLTASLKKSTLYLSESQLWQSKFDKTVVKQMTPVEKKKLSAIWELLKTEQSFLRDLDIVTQTFLLPISEMRTISAKQIQNLFGNIDQIVAVNRRLLERLEAIKDFYDTKQIATVFLEFVHLNLTLD